MRPLTMEVHHHAHEPHKSGHKLFDFLVSSCALLISAISIYMAWHTGHMMERLVHANSWPFLQLGTGNTHEGQQVIGFRLSNAGTGPARIHHFEFLVDGKVVTRDNPYSSLRDLLRACCAEPWKEALARAGGNEREAAGGDYSGPVAQSFLAAGETISPLGWPRTEANKEVWHRFDRARLDKRITMRACYCSVFDECWIAETGKFPPQEVESCAVSR